MPDTSLIVHQFNSTPINQRSLDGYMDATAACKATGKFFADYRRLQTTQDFLQALQTDMGIPITELINTLQGIHVVQQGTWVHPLVAIHLAQWCSPEFAVFVSKCVLNYMLTQGKPARKPSAPKPLSPAQRLLCEARIARWQEQIDATQVKLGIVTSPVVRPLPEPVLHVLPEPTRQMSVKAFANCDRIRLTTTQASHIGKCCSRRSRVDERLIGTIPDDMYGQVNTYDIDILREVFQEECQQFRQGNQEN